MLAINHQPHFLQTNDWAQFWLEANPTNHNFHTHTTTNDEFELTSLIYEFPWHFNQKFWYIPKTGTLSYSNDYSDEPNNINCWDKIPTHELNNLVIRHFNEILQRAKQSSMAFVKFDLNDGLTNRLGLHTTTELLEFSQANIDNKARLSTKKIQYLKTFVADIRSIPNQNFGDILNLQNSDQLLETKNNLFNAPFAVANLKHFWNDSKNYWATTNTNIRRYTKKVLDKDWTVSMCKSEANFEAFWQVYNSTKDRQNFVIHSREYVHQLFQKPQSHLIILSDVDGVPQSAWLGYSWGNSLIYLYGGNEQFSFDNYGQYLIHLCAIYLAKCLGLSFYDLGGYEEGTGYGRFKEQYKAEFREFLGSIDIPVKNLKFAVINNFVNLAKKVKK